MTARYSGRAVREPWAAGSKSAHEAVVLHAGEERYVLRRRGGNPFSDPDLDALVGCEVTVEGLVHNGILFIDFIDEVTPADDVPADDPQDAGDDVD